MANAPFHVFSSAMLTLGSKLEEWQASGTYDGFSLTQDTFNVALVNQSSYNSTTGPFSVINTAITVADVLAVSGLSESSGTGYTTGGTALTSPTFLRYSGISGQGTTYPTIYQANTTTATAYSVGNIVRPQTLNNFLFQCVVAGTTAGGAATPSGGWGTTPGVSQVDGGVTWLNIGYGVSVMTATSPIQWTISGTLTACYGLLFDISVGTSTGAITGWTCPIIGYWDFGAAQTASSGTFGITIPTSGIFPLTNS